MNTVYFHFGAIIVYSIGILTSAKPFIGEDKNFSEDKLRCMDSTESSEYEKSNSFNDFYNKPRPKFEEPDRYISRPLEYNEKRSASNEMFDSENGITVQKRQVGVVYKDEKPIGILQPFQRSYRFIPIREETPYDSEENQELPYNIPRLANIDKRDVSYSIKDPLGLEESYPSILTNFKIGNKLDKKRNFDTLTEENVRNLRSTIRRLRSANSHNTEKIEQELKNILDDMGLIDDEEIHAGKREVSEDPKQEEEELDGEVASERNKRDEMCTTSENLDSENSLVNSDPDLAMPEARRNAVKLEEKEESAEPKSESSRQKRQEVNEGAQLIENLKDSGDLMVTGNKSPLAFSSEVSTRDAEGEEKTNEEYEKRVERQIQSKINSLKEEVKREIEALKKKQTGSEDIQRKKRQVADNLVDEERDELNPAKNPDGELNPLVRKRRHLDDSSSSKNETHSRKKREVSFESPKTRRSRSAESSKSEKKYNARHEDSEEGGELLGDDFDEGSISKRQTAQEYDDVDLDGGLYERKKRSRMQPLDVYNSYLYNNGDDFYDDDGERFKRQNGVFQKRGNKRFVPFRLKPRFRRRIDEDLANRPQQLSDMSDLDLFGALPKSYSGELSRYKRVKRE